LLSYEKVKHIVEVDEKIPTVFTVNSNKKTSDVFIAPDANIDRSFIDTLRLNLDLKFKKMEKTSSNALGKHLWDISEYDKIRVIRIYEANRLIVVVAKCRTLPGDITDTVLGYIYESNEEEQQECPPCLF
jgi:predicted DNA binding protein